jgi:Domain of unknown function DUF11
MSRSAVVIITGLMVVGSVVALLPAQESSRRTASKYRPGNPPPPETSSESSQLGSLPGLAPIVSSAGRPAPGASANALPVTDNPPPALSQGFRSDPRQFTSDSRAYSPAAKPAPAAESALPSEPADDMSQLHSVLKRNRPAVIYESPAPGSSTAPATAAPSTRMPEPPAASPPPKETARAPEPALRGGAAAPPAPQRVPSTTSTGLARTSQRPATIGRTPALRVEIAGPPGITVGKPATYVITLVNDGETVAEDAQVRLALPSWVAVNSSQPSAGEASMQADSHGVARLVWSLPRVASRAPEQLQVQLVSAQGESFDLAVEFQCRPALTQTKIAVMQPQLELLLAGPAEMTFGEEKTFTLTVSNPGTGDAERVLVSVVAGDAPPTQFDAGAIPAGHKKELPLQVVASQPGVINLAISATAESGLAAQTVGKVNIRKADIQIAVAGPPLKFAGTEAIYAVTVVNSGTAAADNVNLSLTLPAGAKYFGGIDGASPTTGGLKWKIAALPPGGERQYEVRLQLTTAGTNRLVVQSQAAASGSATGQAETEVEAVSDLKLVVNDPAGPLPTDEHASYELQVMNRGSQAARQVKIVIQFGEGVEPVSFEGCEARIVPGQVVCLPLSQLGAGEQVTLRVKARAERAGNHPFRVEVTSADADARLVSEGTTRFFSETGRGGAAATTAKKPSLVPAPAAPGLLR